MKKWGKREEEIFTIGAALANFQAVLSDIGYSCQVKMGENGLYVRLSWMTDTAIVPWADLNLAHIQAFIWYRIRDAVELRSSIPNLFAPDEPQVEDIQFEEPANG